MSHPDYSDKPLTPKENQDIRRIIEADRHAMWFWSMLRTWALWIAAVVGGGTLFWEFLSKLVRKLGGS